MKKNIIAYAICLILEASITCILLFTRGITTAGGQDFFHIMCDAFFVPGVIFTGFGLLVVASNGGAFDMLAYGTMSLIALFYRNPAKRKYPTFYDYRQSKEDKKTRYWHLLISGLIFIFISVIFLIIYMQYE